MPTKFLSYHLSKSQIVLVNKAGFKRTGRKGTKLIKRELRRRVEYIKISVIFFKYLSKRLSSALFFNYTNLSYLAFIHKRFLPL